ncbi:MAG: hypothetical protein JNJ53_12595 [Rhizobiales bacterium]|nr:hypothetical protein [Hyphomicrobiales bacterium]
MTLLELLAGLGLLLVPGFALSALLGTPIPAPEALGLSRLTGVALIAIGVMCHSGAVGPISWWVLAGMLVYNAGASAALAYVGAGLGLAGPLLWPAVILHAGLTLWVLLSLRTVAHP